MMNLRGHHQRRSCVTTALPTFVVALMSAISAGFAAESGTSVPVYFDPTNLFRTESDFPSLTSVEYATRTVYGFLDFTTTMGNTVMIFKPGSEPDSTQEPRPSATIAPTKTSSVFAHVETATPEIIEAQPERKQVELSSSHDDEEIPSLLPQSSEMNIHNLFDVKSTVGLEGLFSGFDLDALAPKPKKAALSREERVETRVEENRRSSFVPNNKAASSSLLPSIREEAKPVFPASSSSTSEPVFSAKASRKPFPSPAAVSEPFAPSFSAVFTPAGAAVSSSRRGPHGQDEEEDVESVLVPVSNALVKEHYDFLSTAPRLSVENSFRSEERVEISPSRPSSAGAGVGGGGNKIDVKSKVDVRVEVSDGKTRRKLDAVPELVPNIVSSPSPEKPQQKPTTTTSTTSATRANAVESTPVLEPSVGEVGAGQPIGLITTLGGTTVMTGTTTVHETKVIGTVIDGLYAQVLQSTSHIFFDNEDYFSSPNPGTGNIAVVDDVKTVQSVITGAHTTVITPVLEGTVEPDFYNFRSKAPALEVVYDDYEVERNDESFGRSVRPSIVSTPLVEQRSAAAVFKPAPEPASNNRRPAAAAADPVPEKRNKAQEELLSRLRKNKEKFERLTAEPSAPKPERRAFSPKSINGNGNSNSRPNINPSGRHQNDASAATTLYAYAERSQAEEGLSSRPFATGLSGINNGNRRRQTRYRKKIGPARPISDQSEPEASVIKTSPSNARPSFGNRPRNNGNGNGNHHQQHNQVHAEPKNSGFRAKTVKIQPTSSTSIYKFKLNRPSGRWRWQAADKPKIVIKQSVQASSPNPQSDPSGQQEDQYYEEGPDAKEENRTGPQPDYYNDNEEELQTLEPSLPEPETIRVEMSTPEPFDNTYYEIATIRSPYVFQIGATKTTRHITLTSTLARPVNRRSDAPDIDPSLPNSDDIEATRAPSYHENLIEDNDIMTLPPIGLAGDVALPPFETKLESFSTSELMLKTTLLPVIKSGGTSYHTFTQSYYITRVVTALKTMPPMDAYKFSPHDDLVDFNDHLSLSGSENEARLVTDGNGVQVALPPDFFDDQDLVLAGAKFDPNDMERKLHPELEHRRIHPSPTVQQSQPKTEDPSQDPSQLQQLAYLKFLNPYLNLGGANAVANRVITHSIPVLRTETLYKTDVLPIWDGLTTHYSTITHPIGTKVRTEYDFVTTELPNAAPIQPPVPYPNPLNPFQPQVPFAATVSTPVTVSTRLTSTSLKVYKITLQAKPIFTTITSTKVYDTVITTYSTATVPAPGAPLPYLPFPGYFG